MRLGMPIQQLDVTRFTNRKLIEVRTMKKEKQTEVKTRHQWKACLITNTKKCVNCHGERRRDPKTGKYYYSTPSATYCERSDMELIGNA